MATGLYQNVQELFGIELYAAISVAVSGDSTIVTGVTGKQIRVINYNLMNAGATTLTWKSSAAGAISGPKSFLANQGMVAPYSPKGWVQTAVGEGLVLNSSNNVSIGGELTYILV